MNLRELSGLSISRRGSHLWLLSHRHPRERRPRCLRRRVSTLFSNHSSQLKETTRTTRLKRAYLTTKTPTESLTGRSRWIRRMCSTRTSRSITIWSQLLRLRERLLTCSWSTTSHWTESMLLTSSKTSARRPRPRTTSWWAIFWTTPTHRTAMAGRESSVWSLITSIFKPSSSQGSWWLKGKYFTLISFLCRVNVSLANFADLMIDYPNSKEYAFTMF